MTQFFEAVNKLAKSGDHFQVVLGDLPIGTAVGVFTGNYEGEWVLEVESPVFSKNIEVRLCRFTMSLFSHAPVEVELVAPHKFYDEEVQGMASELADLRNEHLVVLQIDKMGIHLNSDMAYIRSLNFDDFYLYDISGSLWYPERDIDISMLDPDVDPIASEEKPDYIWRLVGRPEITRKDHPYIDPESNCVLIPKDMVQDPRDFLDPNGCRLTKQTEAYINGAAFFKLKVGEEARALLGDMAEFAEKTLCPHTLLLGKKQPAQPSITQFTEFVKDLVETHLSAEVIQDGLGVKLKEDADPVKTIENIRNLIAKHYVLLHADAIIDGQDDILVMKEGIDGSDEEPSETE